MDISLLSFFLIGLVAGAPHCVGMCGGIVGVLSLNTRADKNPRAYFSLLLGYNAGRILSYVLAGMFAGMLGSVIVHTANIEFVRKGLLLFSALIMVALGLYVANIWRGITKLERMGSKLWKWIEPYSRRFIPVKSISSAVMLGILWGWLPCGLVYSVLLSAMSSGSWLSGAGIMLAFGLGTLPLLLSMGYVSGFIRDLSQNTVFRWLSGLFIALFGVYQGMGLFLG